ncbi:hypothetical protein GCM10012287_56490 [Streptomyces daqingensis]|uniref:Uncharacterized protein n=1 Tax=Streptomyces daqingensis TaxID=1472640 RepID=A0ABQ2MV08_9ACTN|nr:hypothetical protein GCM10012287_56490 [Streptomyces daqingensis]
MRGSSQCVLCKEPSGNLILVDIIESGSGPGWGLYACPTPCAQEYAGRSYAPTWLAKELEKLELWPPES